MEIFRYDLLERATIVQHDNDRRYDRGSVLKSEVTNDIGIFMNFVNFQFYSSTNPIPKHRKFVAKAGTLYIDALVYITSLKI